MISDFHTHTTASDGALAPLELLRRAENNGVNRLAITDHDTVLGVRELKAQLASGAVQSNVELVAGVEITAMADKNCVHVLGLWVDTDATSLAKFLSEQVQIRVQRGEEIAFQLGKKGINNALEGAKSIAGGAVLGRPHFARFLVEEGHCSNQQQAFRRWLGKGKVGDIHCAWPSLASAVEAIHAAGGLASLAHPDKYGLTRTRLNRILAGFREAGGDALELISGAQGSSVTANLLGLASTHQLMCSTGSDFHSLEQLWCDIGRQPVFPSEATLIQCS